VYSILRDRVLKLPWVVGWAMLKMKNKVRLQAIFALAKVMLTVMLIFPLNLPVQAAAVESKIPATQNQGVEIIAQPNPQTEFNPGEVAPGNQDNCQNSDDKIVVDPRGNVNTKSHCKP
jgi:hypothetical protein